MDHALVVIDASQNPAPMVREAAELASGVDSALTLLYVTTEEEYEAKRDALAEYLERDDTHYTVDESTRGAEKFARNLAEETISDVDVEYDVVALFGTPEEEVLAYAREHDVDHVFIGGRKRSPVGKAIFRDATQQILLNFDRATTIFMDE